jgi:hypothetical protein
MKKLQKKKLAETGGHPHMVDMIKIVDRRLSEIKTDIHLHASKQSTVMEFERMTEIEFKFGPY